MRTRQNYGWLDRFRVIVALLAITNHTAALASVNAEADFFLTRVLARIVVPFFFMVTGHFVAADFLTPSHRNGPRLIKYIKKTSFFYLFCILLYLPIGIYAGHYHDMNFGSVLRMLLFDGTFYHLWYFPACIIGMLIVYFMSRKLNLSVMTVISAVLYLIGLFGDSYYGLVQKVPALDAIYGFGFQLFSYTRNGLFMAPLFLVLGMWMAKLERERGTQSRQAPIPLFIVGLACSFAVMTIEAFVLRYFQLQRHDSMYLALVPTMFFLYQCLLCLPKEPSISCRKISMWIYILHPAFIVVVRVIAKVLKQTELLVDNSVVFYLAVTLLSTAASLIMAYAEEKLLPRLRSKKNEPAASDLPETENRQNCSPQKSSQIQHTEIPTQTPSLRRQLSPTSRAWIELDTAALAHNVEFLRSCLPKHCRLMPAVKANAYGHGAILIAGLLNRLDVDAFCVACISEGISLRKAGIKGDILILGYTAPTDLPMLAHYQLTQAVVDYPYAQLLEQSGQTLHVHVAIDTGMHRLGLRCENIEEILNVYQMEHLIVDGLFTHLSASDSLHPQDRAFTESQVQAFYQVATILKNHGYACHGLHMLASYGILNLLCENLLPENLPAGQEHNSLNSLPDAANRISPSALAADYVRPGIALYGVLSTVDDSERWHDFLQPVLSLKARIASVRMLYAGEAAGYGLAYTAKEDMRIATLSIGYADGLPRELSYGKGSVLIDGYEAPVIGRICMDQTIVDVSHIPHVTSGDTAVIIGKSGTGEITAGQLAEKCNTITNELLSRLSSRLERTTVS